jgi:N-acetylneuraminate synthase
MNRKINIGQASVGDGEPVYVIAEIGINHNGDLNLAKKLIDVAKAAGCNAVKFQKRTPEKCVPPEMKDQMRDTPWGYITYLEYRHKIELGTAEYKEIDLHCRRVGIPWFASPWDEESLDFLQAFDLPCYKIPSAMLTHRQLLEKTRSSGKPVILSTGMSSLGEIRMAADTVGMNNLLIAHCTSTYPCPKEELNLRVIQSFKQMFPCPIGYSGHEVGLAPTLAAVAIGAAFVERHITLDRSMWGSDHPSSVEPGGLFRLVKDIRGIEVAMGDAVKRVYDSELPVKKRLRNMDTLTELHPK